MINFQALADSGTISPEDLNQFRMVDSPEEGFAVLRDGLTKYHLGPQPRRGGAPEIAKTRP
jgi:hypothetical protein